MRPPATGTFQPGPPYQQQTQQQQPQYGAQQPYPAAGIRPPGIPGIVLIIRSVDFPNTRGLFFPRNLQFTSFITIHSSYQILLQPLTCHKCPEQTGSQELHHLHHHNKQPCDPLLSFRAPVLFPPPQHHLHHSLCQDNSSTNHLQWHLRDSQVTDNPLDCLPNLRPFLVHHDLWPLQQVLPCSSSSSLPCQERP